MIPSPRTAGLLACAALGFAGCTTSEKTVTIQEDTLSESAIEREANARLDDMGVPGQAIKNNANQRMAFVEDLRRTRALAAEAVAAGVADSPIFKQRLEAQRESILAGMYLETRMNTLVNDAALRKYFEQNKSRFNKEQRSAFHIVTKTEVAAKAAVTALQEPGADKDMLAKEFAPSAPEGAKSGSLGTFMRGQMLKPLEDAVFSTPVGQVWPEPVQTSHGWHAILVTGEVPGKPVRFEEVRAEVEQAMKSDLHTKLVHDALKGEIGATR
jgi:parvulin-like peptidyl-prolyl isomerase